MYYHDNYSYWQPRPTQNDFELEVISKHPDFNGRPLRKYAVEGINTIGCWGDEPFEVHFHNKSIEDVQVRISLDGTDILTGKAASLEVNHDMWVVRAGKTLHLKAWAETSQGGARFVFTSGDKSVALHAHGDVSHKGIISAAVFTERDRPTPPRHVYRPRRVAYYQGSGGIKGGSVSSIGGIYTNNSAMPAAAGSPTPDAVMESFGGDLHREISDDGMNLTKSLKKEASVGAGEQVSQRTVTVKGLDNPILNSIVRVRYMWYDDLVVLVKKASIQRMEDPHPTGFPAEKIRSFADLSNVPRVKSVAVSSETEVVRLV